MFYHSDWETEDWSNVFKKTSKVDLSKPTEEIEEVTDLAGFTHSIKYSGFKENPDE